MAGFHSTASDAGLHARTQILGRLGFWGAGRLGLRQ